MCYNVPDLVFVAADSEDFSVCKICGVFLNK